MASVDGSRAQFYENRLFVYGCLIKNANGSQSRGRIILTRDINSLPYPPLRGHSQDHSSCTNLPALDISSKYALASAADIFPCDETMSCSVRSTSAPIRTAPQT